MHSEKCIKISEIFFIGVEHLGNPSFVFNGCAMQVSCDNALSIGLGTEGCRCERLRRKPCWCPINLQLGFNDDR
jgi:hypothetical protein